MAVRKVLVLFAHPALEKSRINIHLCRAAKAVDGVTFNDLYERYPDFAISVHEEQALLREHDVIVWQHPFYWYSAPALLKEWQDLVLEHGFAYGQKGTALQGKVAMNVLTTGGPAAAYSRSGYNRFSYRELLAPFDQTAALCGMRYLAPFVVSGTHRLEPETEMPRYLEAYVRLLTRLRDGQIDLNAASAAETLNSFVLTS